MDTIRTFLAIDIDNQAKKKVYNLSRKFRSFKGKINFTDSDNLHITMNFLGDVESAKTVRVCEIVKSVAAEFSEFQFDINGFLPIAKKGRIEMIWAEIQDSSGKMEHIQDMLNTQFAEEGFRTEKRKFNPHLTIARIRSTPEGQKIFETVQQYSNQHIATVNVDKIMVYTSELTPKGPIYTPLTKCPLQG